MACPTCSHTMVHLTSAHGMKFYWCSRCGTLKTVCAAGHEDVSTAALVSRVKDLEDLLGPNFKPHLHRIGILESIRPEHERQ
jgi:ssDNA-binding Zn-finger/Zn-ribbon topoisomerase 1